MLCSFFFCLDAKEKEPKRKSQGFLCEATATVLEATSD